MEPRYRPPIKLVILAMVLACLMVVEVAGVRIHNYHVFFFDLPDRSGWVQVDGELRYLDRHAGVVTDSLLEVDGNTYYFQADGSLGTGEIEVDSEIYLFNPVTGIMQTGWVTRGEHRYYYLETGPKVVDREHTIDGSDFLFDADGAEITGEVERNGAQYFYEPLTGKLKSSEKKLGNVWYYFQADGTRFGTGWVEIEPGRIAYYDGEAGMQYGEREIDGKKYLLNISTGGRLTGTVYFNGRKYTIDDDGVILKKQRTSVWSGIDVSRHQEDIDWAQVKKSGVQFAIIRAGYFAAIDEPVFEPDAYFVSNVLEAQEQGISVGAYIYLYAYTRERLVEGIDAFDAHARENRIALDLPVFLDVEDEKRFKSGSDKLGGYSYRTKLIRYGMNLLQDRGYQTGFYTFQKWAEEEIDAEKLYNQGYNFWLARWYQDNEDLDPDTLAWKDEKHPSLWQYRSTGTVPGIDTKKDVDKNYLYWNAFK